MPNRSYAQLHRKARDDKPLLRQQQLPSDASESEDDASTSRPPNTRLRLPRLFGRSSGCSVPTSSTTTTTTRQKPQSQVVSMLQPIEESSTAAVAAVVVEQEQQPRCGPPVVASAAHGGGVTNSQQHRRDKEKARQTQPASKGGGHKEKSGKQPQAQAQHDMNETTKSFRAAVLPTNVKDSRKKERPLFVPLFKARKNPNATDPPIHGSLAKGAPTPRATAVTTRGLSVQPNSSRRLAQDLQQLDMLATNMHDEEKKVEDDVVMQMRSPVAANQNEKKYDGSTIRRRHRAARKKQQRERDKSLEQGPVEEGSSLPQQQPQQPPQSPATTKPVSSSHKPQKQSTPFLKTAAMTKTTKPVSASKQQSTPIKTAATSKPTTTTTADNTSRQAAVKALLSRPFERNQQTNSHWWVVQVSSAEWDADETIWKYRILVQRRPTEYTSTASNNDPDLQPHSMTAAFTWRSLADFYWLERALQREFAGGLLLPVLSLALEQQQPQGATAKDRTNNNKDDNAMPVPAETLRHWLSDVLNGVRGQGEVLLDQQEADVIRSESMEAFLYRNSGPLVAPNQDDNVDQDRRKNSARQPKQPEQEESFVQTLFSKPLLASIVPNLELCTGGGESSGLDEDEEEEDTDGDTGSFASPPAKDAQDRRPRLVKKLPIDMLTCSSRALGTAATLEVQDSFADNASTVVSSPPQTSGVYAIHSELLEAEKELSVNYLKTAVQATKTLDKLMDEEEQLGMAWKRFAISLSNLFAYEKDVEHAKFANQRTKKENMPYRKLEKSTVDDCLRVMARHKSERSVPALKALSGMLSAFVADLSAVKPSVDAYNEAMTQLSLMENVSGSFSRDKSTGSWEDRIRSTVDDVKTKAARTFRSPQQRAASPQEHGSNEKQNAQLARLLANERLLRESLTTMCCATTVRVARMTWRHWNTEAHHCALLHSASVSLQTKVDIASKDDVSKLINRHLIEDKNDRVTELELVRRVVNIGNVKKFDPATDVEHLGTDVRVEVDNDSLDEERDKATRRDKALQIARERVGRWDAKLALAIMEAVGVDDPNVRVEETTRDLRLIRKYAIGLRENLNRCIEAIQLVRAAMKKASQGQTMDGVKEQYDAAGIRETRNQFLVEIAKLFSGTLPNEKNPRKTKSSSPAVAVLSKAGVNTDDPLGWSSAYQPAKMSSRRTALKNSVTTARIGDLAATYVHARDAQTDWLLSSLSELLNEYFERVEVVESFVYMECVGIQLEKYFSQKRTQALTAFEKKTDITTAINIAKRKRLGALVNELQAKLDGLGQEVSHTVVKETKEAHLESKNLKSELHELAMRRLTRARETSTERVVTVLSFWAKEEGAATSGELKALGEAMAVLEKLVGAATIDKF